MLYTVNKSPLMFGNLKSVLTIAPAGDPILLYEDGVYAAAEGTANEDVIQQALERHLVYALLTWRRVGLPHWLMASRS